jgi:hypothetical protein
MRAGVIVVRAFRNWAFAPIVIPRAVVVTIDILFVALGTDLALSGTVALSAQLSDPYLFTYGVTMAVTAVTALIGCAAVKPSLEMWGALLLFCLLSLYVVVSAAHVGNDLQRLALVIVVIIASVLKGWRGLDLLFAAIRRTVSRHA